MINFTLIIKLHAFLWTYDNNSNPYLANHSCNLLITVYGVLLPELVFSWPQLIHVGFWLANHLVFMSNHGNQSRVMNTMQESRQSSYIATQIYQWHKIRLQRCMTISLVIYASSALTEVSQVVGAPTAL